MDKDLINDLDETIKHCEEKAKRLRTEAEQVRNIGELISNPKYPYNEPVKNCLECAKEHEQLAEWLKELKSFKEGQNARKDFIETVLSVAINFDLDELDVALYLIERGIKLDDFKYNDDRYNYFKEFFEVHGLLKGAENG